MSEKSLVDDVDFGLMFRIKKKSGLYYKIAEANRSGMIPMVNISNNEDKSTVNWRRVIALSELEFVTYAGHDNLAIGDVFKNISGYFEKHDDIPEAVELMGVMVPEYDEDLFHESDAKHILDWYVQWVKNLNKIIND